MSTTCQPFEIVEEELAAYFELQPAAEEAAGTLAHDLPPLAWAEAVRRIDDRPFTLDEFKPLAEIYNDDHPYVVIIKPAQVGVSEMAITRAVHALAVGARYWNTDKAGLNVGYLFPTQAALSDFSKERFSSLRSESDYLASIITDYDDVHFKQAGASYLYLRGAWSTKALKSFPADVLFLDEFDEMAKSAIALASKRLRQSTVKRQWRFSTPTLPGVGIHAEYLQSDQRVWEVHCKNCDAWNALDFFRDVRADGESWEVWREWRAEKLHRAGMIVACPACRDTLDRLGEGRWKPQRPEIKRIRGYHVPSLCFPSVSLTELAVTSISDEPNEIAEFYRSDLGLPYEPGGSRITEEMLRKLSSDLPGGKLPEGAVWRMTTMGVDVGKRLHFRISSTGPNDERYVRAMGFVRTWDELDVLMATYGVRSVVVDALPELHACSAWALKHSGKVLRAFYPTAKALTGRLFRVQDAENPDVESGTVQINRTMAMDAVYNAVATGKEHWPAAIHNDPEVLAHMKAPVRVVTVDDQGQEHASWLHTSPDHLFHACVYDVAALKLLPPELPAKPFSSMGQRSQWRR